MLKKYKKRGMTLVELILAIVIIGIIVIAFLSALSGGFVNLISMGSKTKAVAEAQAVIDFIHESGSIDKTELLAAFPIADEVDISNLYNASYDANKPIYYSVENESIGSATVITTQKVTVLVYYHGGSRYVTLSALVP